MNIRLQDDTNANYHVRFAADIELTVNEKAQLMLANQRDAKRRKKFLHFEVITSYSQVGNPVFIVIKFLIQITSTYNS